MVIEEDTGSYLVESPFFLQQQKCPIRKVLYKNVDDDIAAYWGVVRVSYKI